MTMTLSPTQLRLAAIWIFVALNYIYCDVLGLMDADQLREFLDGRVGQTAVTQGFLLGAAVLMEVPFAMIPAALLLAGRAGRVAQLAGGTVMTLVQAASLTFGTNTAVYLFCSLVEIACTAAVVVIAWRWRPAASPFRSRGE